MSKNPYSAPSEPAAQADSATELGAGKTAYNIVTDTVTGVNLRGSDNKFQAKFTAAAILIVALIGALAALFVSSWKLPWYGGALIGAFAGMVSGILLSGIILMLYRGLRHLRGKHD